jgi:hypothetical protein
MATQPHVAQSTRSKEHQKLIGSAVAFNNKAEIALRDLDSLLIAALTLICVEEGRIDADFEDRKGALETLLEYARCAVDDGKDGLEKLWDVTAGYLFGEQPESAATSSDTELEKEKA